MVSEKLDKLVQAANTEILAVLSFQVCFADFPAKLI